MLTKADGHLGFDRPARVGLRACARRRSVAGRERDAGRRAAEAVRAARRRRRRRGGARPARCWACAPEGPGDRLRGAARSRSPSCSSRDGGGCRPRRCSPGTASRRARSSRDGPGRKPPPRASRAGRKPARRSRGPALTARRWPGRCSSASRWAARTPTARCRRRWIARPRSAAEDRGLATELVYGVLRRPGAHRPRAGGAGDAAGSTGWTRARCIALRVGAYQILFLDRVPAYAAVDDAVDACKQVAGRGVAGFANALLRRLGARRRAAAARRGRRSGRLPGRRRRPARLAGASCCSPSCRPPRRSRSPPASPTPAPVTLRANTGRVTRDELAAAARGGAAGRDAGAVGGRARRAGRAAAGRAGRDRRPGARACSRSPTPARRSSVELCGAAAGERILDACAGSGGKTAHLLALAGDRARVDAVDIAADKLGAARATLRRLGLAGATLDVGGPDRAARRSDAALSPHPARRAVQRAGRVAPPSGGAAAARARRSRRRWPRSSCACCRSSRRRCCRAACCLRRLHVRAPRMRRRRRGVPARAPAFRDRAGAGRGRPRAVGAAHRRHGRDPHLAAPRRRRRLLRGAIAAGGRLAEAADLGPQASARFTTKSSSACLAAREQVYSPPSVLEGRERAEAA